ncbi:MAG: hypothetical protein KC652_10530 [Cyanobacteria bacterium HKST-UBA01]|nr:hypothetical protein [Cyanobacteria bacterium HKST-UBA01]
MRFSADKLFVIVTLSLAIVATGAELGHAGDRSTSLRVKQDKLIEPGLLKEAKKAFQRQAFDLSLIKCDEILAGEATEEIESEALLLKARAYGKLGKYKKSVAVLTGIIESTDSSIERNLAYSYRAEMYEKARDFDQALLDREKLQSML